MDLAIATTTIYIPEVLRDYRRECPDALIVVAGDLKTPEDEVRALCAEIDAVYLSPKHQADMDAALSEALGWNVIQRRNFATLEALRQGAEVVMLLDDDNAPTRLHGSRVTDWFDGEQVLWSVIWNHRWFNIGQYASDHYYARGYPYDARESTLRGFPHYLSIETQGRVGVFSSLIYGDPDVGATERIERRPHAHRYDLPGGDGIAYHPRYTWGPINSQATTWAREFAPLALLPPGLGRGDDIAGGYIAQRVMGEHDAHVVFGEPRVTQERNPHNLVTDLKAELWVIEHTTAFCDYLESVPLPGKNVMDDLACVVDALSQADDFPWPLQAQQFCDRWLDAIARVM